MRKPYSFAWIVLCAGVAFVQYLAVKLGLLMGIAHGNVSPVWPATGFAIAVLMRYGVNLWPGVAIGSFVGLAQTGVGTPVALGEAAAALLEAVTAVWLVKRWIGSASPFSRTRDVIRFLIIAGGIATAVSATVGVSSLFFGGVVQWKSFGYLWGTWWLGDVMGALIVAPFLIVWTAPGAWRLDRATWTKSGLVFAILILAGILAFWGPFVSATGVSDYPLAFLTLPLVVAATFLARRKGATAACLICSAMAISGTAQGLGPFFRGSVNESLLLLQSYLVVVSATATILAAVLAERDFALEELQSARDELDNRVVQRTQELLESNAQLKREVAERRHAEEELRKSEQRFRALFNNVFVGIGLLDRSGRFVEVNPALAKMLGYTQEEVVERSPLDLTHPDDLAKSKDNIDALVEEKTGSYRTEKRYIRKDGSILWGDVAASAIYNCYGKYEAAIGAISDITQRKRAEALVRLRLELLEFAAASSLEELLQKTLDEVGHLTDSPIGFYHFVEEDQETLSLQAWSTRTMKEFCTAEGKGMHYPINQAGVWVDCVRERRPVIHNDYASLPHRKGLPVGHAPVIRELVVPIMRSGKIVAILGIGNKVSDYTQEDVETVAYLADIAWEIFERKRAEEQVKASLKEKEILLREIHHRVKNNLTLICGLLTLQAGYADGTHRKLFEELEARVMSMALAHEKLYQTESLADLNLEEYIDGLVDHLISSKSLGVSVRLSKEMDGVSFGLDTAIPVGFIVTELVSNSLKHAFPDGRQGEIGISLRSLGEKQFELVVSDNGIGMPDEIDLENTTSLGMDLVAAFVTKLKGKMEILRGNGTEIRLKFKEI